MINVVIPELVAEMCGLSLGVLAGGAGVGLLLWLFGWKSHRFWIVMLTTVAAGVYGLHEAESLRSPPLVAGMLLAVSAGVLALALLRLFAFGAGGLTGLVVAQAMAPSFDQPLVVFVVSGLVSLLLFRWFLMALSSFVGGVVLCYCGLALLQLQGVLEAVPWVEQNTILLSWASVAAGLAGFLIQFVIARSASRRDDDEEEEQASRLFPFRRSYRRAG